MFTLTAAKLKVMTAAGREAQQKMCEAALPAVLAYVTECIEKAAAHGRDKVEIRYYDIAKALDYSGVECKVTDMLAELAIRHITANNSGIVVALEPSYDQEHEIEYNPPGGLTIIWNSEMPSTAVPVDDDEVRIQAWRRSEEALAHRRGRDKLKEASS